MWFFSTISDVFPHYIKKKIVDIWSYILKRRNTKKLLWVLPDWHAIRLNFKIYNVKIPYKLS